jgi:hypothetical protein
VLVNVVGRPPGRTEQGARGNTSFCERWTGLLPQLDRQSSGFVEATARRAYEQRFNMTSALNAMTDLRGEAHEYGIGNVFPRAGETGSRQGFISLLEGPLERRSAA